MYYAGDDTNKGTGGWGEQRSGINYHILRYADVILMAAEAAVLTDAEGAAPFDASSATVSPSAAP